MTRRIKKKPEEELDALVDSVLDPRTPPIANVKPGETLEVETWSALARVINPTTGPLYIEGAEPGDTLVVDIINIELPSQGIVGIIPGFGALEGWLNLMEPKRKICKIENNTITYVRDDGRKLELKADPLIGTIGVAPEVEAISSLTPGRHGGNMDCPDIRPGNKLLLPVTRPGALFKLGDVHAIQGDGEVCGVAAEVDAMVTLKVSLRKGWTINWPRIEAPDEIMTVGSARPLEDAARYAYREMVEWMVADYGWDRDDAYMFLSLAGKARIAQIVDPLYTVVAKLSKVHLRMS
ncbi:acetamidase [Candidatus Bathyarchaeota archaeon]|jgi:acetamidase/formamidase|nr:acetamidase [Candidatus Bathyarchaeota archaeon]MDP6048351.1 acetamidase/formamidase family protein [Candidatus Bathyarchaeota archaeon]MDP7443831.1 acetamidase/formamidase family protein [Candidatus Bathyarchaeota archaeon]|tara:strand:- start:2842 stop:3723 length:882 start_codon:yes stop_codon:yes gene_type:complete